MPPVGQCRTTPVVRDVALLGLVPAGDPAVPDLFAQMPLQHLVKLLGRFSADLKDSAVAAGKQLQAPQDIPDLAFDHENDRVMAQICVGAIEHEEIRKLGSEDAQIGERPPLPGFVQANPVAAEDLHGIEKFRGLKPGRIDDGVHRQVARRGTDSLWRDAFDRIGHQLHVLAMQRLQVVIGEQHPLAAGGKLRNQLRVKFLGGRPPHPEAGPGGKTVIEDCAAVVAEDPQLKKQVHQQSLQTRSERDYAIKPSPGPRVAMVVTMENPICRSLQDTHLPSLLGELWDDLNRTGTIADHGDALIAGIKIVVPTGRVEGGAAEGVDSLNRGQGGATELAHRADEKVAVDCLARVGRDGPMGAFFVPACRGDGGPKSNMGLDRKPFAAVAEILKDFGLGCVFARPVGFECEGERIEHGGDIAAATGIGIVEPGAAEVVGLFQDRQRVETRFFEPHGQAESADARPDDYDSRPGCSGGL